jgi:hypothetical protein
MKKKKMSKWFDIIGYQETNNNFPFRLVIETIKDLEDTRKCWRLVNGVLFEKTKAEVVPELNIAISNMDAVTK